jgi:hypothetical protein
MPRERGSGECCGMEAAVGIEPTDKGFANRLRRLPQCTTGSYSLENQHRGQLYSKSYHGVVGILSGIPLTGQPKLLSSLAPFLFIQPASLPMEPLAISCAALRAAGEHIVLARPEYPPAHRARSKTFLSLSSRQLSRRCAARPGYLLLLISRFRLLGSGSA